MSSLENMLQELKAPQTGYRPPVVTLWEFATFLGALAFVASILWLEIAAHGL